MERSGTDDPVRARHFSSLVTGPIVRFVRRTLGEATVERMLAQAGDLPPRAVLEDPGGWCTYDETRRLLTAAAEALGGRDALQRSCRYIDRQDGVDAFEALGSPGEVLRLVAEANAKYTTVVTMEAVEIADDYGLVSAQSAPGYPRYELMCAVTAGTLGQAAELFGFPVATVDEEQCETRGDDRCTFRVRWSPTEYDAERRNAQLERELLGYRNRIHNLQATVADMVSGAGVDTVLDRITSRATHAVTAHRYVLAVRTGEQGSTTRVHQIGFDPAEAAEVAEHLLAGDVDDATGSRLVVDVRSGVRRYGRLAAFNPPGVGFLPHERPVFEAYAKLAAAALDSATALEEARRQAEVAHALVELGRALARVTTAEEAAQRLAEAVTRAVDVDMALVSLYDPSCGVLRTVGMHGFTDPVVDLLRNHEVRQSDVPEVRWMHDSDTPVFVESGGRIRILDPLLEVTGAQRAVIVPITNGVRLYGVVIALSHHELRLDDNLRERLAGLADQAVTALQNAELLDAVQHQATHDSLTGTANQRLLADRVDVALEEARRHGDHVGVLFVDVDRFKAINDTLGHPAGDLALQQVAERMCGAVRAVDVVSRLGGDEFVVLLPGLVDPTEAALVAQRILTSLEPPFVLDDHEVAISASIGICVRPAGAVTYDELLASADAAMYCAKAAGGEVFHTATP